MSFLSPDSAFMRSLGSIVDAIVVTVLMAVSSIPLVTIGAAATAGHDAIRKSLIGQGHLGKNYWRAFRENLGKATALWGIFAAALLVEVYAVFFMPQTMMLVPKFALAIVWLIGFEWVWAFQARFENSVGRTMANAYVVGVSHIGATLLLIAIDAVYAAIVVGSWIYMPEGLFLLGLLGYGMLIMLHTPIIERVFRPLVAASQESGDDDGSDRAPMP
ncbi:MAG: YesL family protein [Bifidobacterium minimum]|nr:YesL family protein [Bifidobacterium minimum]